MSLTRRSLNSESRVSWPTKHVDRTLSRYYYSYSCLSFDTGLQHRDPHASTSHSSYEAANQQWYTTPSTFVHLDQPLTTHFVLPTVRLTTDISSATGRRAVHDQASRRQRSICKRGSDATAGYACRRCRWIERDDAAPVHGRCTWLESVRPHLSSLSTSTDTRRGFLALSAGCDGRRSMRHHRRRGNR